MNVGRYIPPFLLPLLLNLLSCASSAYHGSSFWSEEKIDAVSFTPDAFPDVGAVILVDEAALTIREAGGIPFTEMTRHTVIQILGERGYDYANIVIPFESNSKITRIRARTILPDGESVPLQDKQIYDADLFPEYIFYSDLKAKRFTMPAIRPGCIIEYEWQRTVDNYSLWTRWQLQRDIPVQLSRYTINVPSRIDIRWKAYGTDIPIPPEVTAKGAMKTYTWQMRNIPAFKGETSMPPGDKQIAHLMFSPVGVDTWDDIAEWYHRLSSDRMRPDNSIRQTVQTVTRNASGPYERLQRIFEFVRDHIRYIAIDIGPGGYQPHSAKNVLSEGFGDCKDMTALIVAMAEAAGIDAWPAFVSTWRNGEADTSLVSHAHFNHVIALAKLPDGTEVWMDPTEKRCAFGALPWYDQDRFSVIIRKSGKARLQKTPASPASENLARRNWDITIGPSGAADGAFEMIFQGAQATMFRQQAFERNPASLDAWVIQDLLSLFPIGHADNIKLHGLTEFEQPLRISGTFSSLHLIPNEKDLYSFYPSHFTTFDWHQLFTNLNREYSIRLKHPMQIEDRITLYYPDSWICVSGAFQDGIATAFGVYDWRMSVQDLGKAVYARTIRMTETRIDVSEYPAFREFLNRIALSDQSLVLFRDVDF